MQGVQEVRTSLPLGVFAAILLLTASPSLGQVTSGTAPAAPARRGTSVAVIDINHIFKNYTSFQKAMEGVQNDIASLETYLRTERQQVVEKAEKLKSLNGGSSQYAALEEELANAQTQVNLETSRRRKAILDREAKIYFNAYQEIERQVNSLADRYGIDMVMRFQSEPMDPNKRESVLKRINTSVIFQRNLNITEFVLQELNRPPHISQRP